MLATMVSVTLRGVPATAVAGLTPVSVIGGGGGGGTCGGGGATQNAKTLPRSLSTSTGPFAPGLRKSSGVRSCISMATTSSGCPVAFGGAAWPVPVCDAVAIGEAGTDVLELLVLRVGFDGEPKNN